MNKIIYQMGYSYLVNMLPEGLSQEDLEKYFIGDRRDFVSIEDIYEQFIHSAQNYRSMPQSISNHVQIRSLISIISSVHRSARLQMILKRRQDAVAKRAEELGAGLRLSSIKEDDILKAVTRVIEEKNFKQGVKKISESFKNSGGIKEAVAFIENIVS